MNTNKPQTDVEKIAYLLDRTANFPNKKLRDGSLEKIAEILTTSNTASRIDETERWLRETIDTKAEAITIRGLIKNFNDRLAELRKLGES